MTDISRPDNAMSVGIEDAGSTPRWFTRRRLMFVGAATLIGSGIALNWGLLTAIGLAPVLLALAPCAVMCGLGMCMKGGSGKGCSKSSDEASPE